MIGGIRRTPSDALFSLLIRERASWRCERCDRYFPEGERQGIHCSHIFSRRNKSTRWHPLNAVAHCFACHLYLTENPIVFATWAEQHLGSDKYDELRTLASIPVRMTPDLTAHVLQNLKETWAWMRRMREEGVIGRIEFPDPMAGEVKAVPKRKRAKKAKAKGPKKSLTNPKFKKKVSGAVVRRDAA